ncbi:MAG: ABC transporter permease [Arachnia sp.]
MIRAIRIELSKMRRLNSLPLLGVLVVAVSVLSSITVFTSTPETRRDPAALPWAGLLLTYTLMAAMTSPILVAVLASRHTDIEHTGSGWILAGCAGYTPGLLCRAKLVATGIVLLPAILAQSLLVIGIGRLAGISVPLEAGAWARYTALLFGLNLGFLALHIWLAAILENQLISVGLGTLGAFLAAFSLLVPGTVSRFIPWGYYAMISQVGTPGGTLAYVSPPYAWIAGFLALVAACFAVATRRLDRREG